MSSSAHPTVAHEPVETPGGVSTVTAPAPSTPPAVELVGQTASDNPTLVRFYRNRARLFALINLCALAILLARDLFTANDTYAGSRIAIFATALALQAVIVVLTRLPWANSVRRCAALGVTCASVLVLVIGANEFDALRRAELTNHVFASDVRSVIGVHYANAWALMWFAVIFIDATVYPRTVRWMLGVGGVVAVISLSTCLAAYAANPALTAADLRVLIVQTVFWVVLATALGVICQSRLESLQQQADKAKRFGQYKLTRKLESGGMGEVHLAEHLLLKRPSVIKMVRADRATDPSLLARFEREVRILATLTHPNTVAVFDYGYTSDGTFYYVMEYLPGLDLDRLVTDRGPLPPGRVVHLLRQVCGALREAHAVGLIHRDVKPKNVMACERGGMSDVAKLLDFGLVQVDMGGDSRLTGSGAVMGTPAYMSPEQAAGLPTDVRSDVYSLGATAYFLLTGKPPFERATIMLTLTAHITDQPPALGDHVPRDLAAIVMRCLAKKPEERFASTCELAAALAACVCTAEWSEPHAATWWSVHRPTSK